jgi:hypothetical protein
MSKSSNKKICLNSKKIRSHSSSHRNNENTHEYFCHYKNALYMGGIKSFKKEGRGIILHDSGICLISSYNNDHLHGHNIFFTKKSLLSA